MFLLEIYGICTGYLREIYGKCLSNISRPSNPLYTGVSRDLRDMLGYFKKDHNAALHQRASS